MSALRYGPFMIAPDEAVRDAYVMNLAAADTSGDDLQTGLMLLAYARGEDSFESTVSELGGVVAPATPICELADFIERQAAAFEALAETPAPGVPGWFQRPFCRHSARKFRAMAAALRGRPEGGA